MIVAVGVLIAAATLVAPATPTLDPEHLPALPAQGFAVSSGAALSFVDLQGHVIGRTEGFRFASENTFGAGMPRFTDSGGRLWRLDRAGRRFAPADDGQLLQGGATVSFVARTRTWLVRRYGRVLLSGAPRELPFVSERRDVVSRWTGSSRRLGGAAGDSIALGWTNDGRAHPLSNGCLPRHVPWRPGGVCGRPWP